MQTEKKRIPVECFTRTVGYFRPVNQMHEAKQEEVRQRKLYDANKHIDDYYNE